MYLCIYKDIIRGGKFMKKSIKNVFCVLLSATMLLGGVSAVYGGEKSISLQINGSEISAEVPPTVIDGRTMVPVRAIFEAVGANIDFNAETKTITAKKGDTTVKMTVGANAVTVNNKEVQLDAPVVIVNGRTLAPARFVAETFGYTVQWDSENKIVEITGGESTEFYKDYSDLPDYGSFSGATLLGNEKIDVDGFVGQGYIYDFKYDKSKFSSGDDVDREYVNKLKENGWEYDGKTYGEENAEIMLFFRKGPMLCGYSVCNNHKQVAIIITNVMGKDIDLENAVTV
jgi:hypothetical protein